MHIALMNIWWLTVFFIVYLILKYFQVRVYSAYIKDIEDKPQSTCWGSKMPLGQLMTELPNNSVGSGGWVHDVSFSHDGTKLAWVCLNYFKIIY